MRALRFLLCAAGADPNADWGSGARASSGGRTPFFAACFTGYHDNARILFAGGATPDHDCTGRGKCPRDIDFPE